MWRCVFVQSVGAEQLVAVFVRAACGAGAGARFVLAACLRVCTRMRSCVQRQAGLRLLSIAVDCHQNAVKCLCPMSVRCVSKETNTQSRKERELGET